MSLSTAFTVDGDPATSVCRAYGGATDDSGYARRAAAGGDYAAVVDQPALPGALEAPALRICRGAAVDLTDRWAFFDDLAPAAAFVRAGRTSSMSASWDLFEAAEVRAFCAEHHREEAALLLGRQVYEPSEIQDLARHFCHSVRS